MFHSQTPLQNHHKNISEVYLVLWPFPIKGCGGVGLKLVFQHKQVSSALPSSSPPLWVQLRLSFSVSLACYSWILVDHSKRPTPQPLSTPVRNWQQSTRDYHPRCPKRRALGLHSEAACFVCFSCCMFFTHREV